jgi:hypothetical protein
MDQGERKAMKWLLVLTSFSGDVQMMHVTKEQCLVAVNFYSWRLAPRITANCFPPDAKYDVEGDGKELRDRGGKGDVHSSGYGRKDLPQMGDGKQQ